MRASQCCVLYACAQSVVHRVSSGGRSSSVCSDHTAVTSVPDRKFEIGATATTFPQYIYNHPTSYTMHRTVLSNVSSTQQRSTKRNAEKSQATLSQSHLDENTVATKLHDWLLTLNYTPLPDLVELKQLCRGNALNLFHYLSKHVRSEPEAAAIKQNLAIAEKQSNKQATSNVTKLQAKRNKLREAISGMKQQVSNVQLELSALSRELATEEQNIHTIENNLQQERSKHLLSASYANKLRHDIQQTEQKITQIQQVLAHNRSLKSQQFAVNGSSGMQLEDYGTHMVRLSLEHVTQAVSAVKETAQETSTYAVVHKPETINPSAMLQLHDLMNNSALQNALSLPTPTLLSTLTNSMQQQIDSLQAKMRGDEADTTEQTKLLHEGGKEQGKLKSIGDLLAMVQEQHVQR